MRTPPRHRSGVAGGILALVMVVSGCSSTEPSADLPAAITCTTQVRPTSGSTAGEESASVTVDRVDSLAVEAEELDLGPFRLAVSYAGEAPEGRSVLVTVSSPSDEVIARDLYQLGDGAVLRSAFAGGHGFTGLRYVYTQGAELQYFCAAEE